MSDTLDRAARRVAAAWSDDVLSVERIAISENAVYRVDTSRLPFILRLHRPGYNTAAEMASELVWVEALAEAGIDVARPLHTPSGDGHVETDVSGDLPRLAGAVAWVDGRLLGEIFEDGLADLAERYRQLGRLLGRVRAHSETWVPAPGFTRRRWDTAGLLGDDALWGRFWEVPEDTNTRALLATARNRLVAELDSWPIDNHHFGLIHADAHPSNVFVDGDRMVLIDFDDCGWSWYAYELAVALHPFVTPSLHDAAKTSLIAGHRDVHPLSDEDVGRIPTLLTIRSLIHVSWLAARLDTGRDDLPDSIARAATDAEAYLDR